MIAVFGVLAGASLGSFLRLVWDRAGMAREPARSWMMSRSRCPGCQRRLSAAELIPVVSWLALGGRCRCRRMALPAGLLLAELAGAAGGAVLSGLWLVLQ